MASDLVMPKFATEEEEANWIDNNRHLIEAEIELAFDEGRMRRGGLLSPSQRTVDATTVHLGPEDSARARVLAAKRHVAYEIYLQQLIHEGLNRDSSAA